MKNEYPGINDKPLQSVLSEWKVASPLPPSFREQVWRRIQGAESRPGAANSFVDVLTNWVATVLPRPASTVCYLAALLAMGATIGWAQSQQKTDRVSHELRQRYVRSIDPYQTFP